MRRVVMLVMGMVLLADAVMALAEEERPGAITTIGYADTLIAPDRAVWKIRIVERGRDLEKVKAENDEQLGKLVRSCRRMGVPGEDLRIGRISIEREFKKDEHGNIEEFRGYRLVRNMTVMQRDLQRVDSLLTVLVANTALEVRVSYDATFLESVQREMHRKAAGIALGKARDLARVAGTDILGIASLSEFPPQGTNREYSGIACQKGIIQRQEFIPESIKVWARIFAVVRVR